MYSKRKQLPLEVTNWMEKDLTLRKITANSRLLTNDTRQNIILSRQFFSDLLTLSFTRYRKITEIDFDKKSFLRSQRNKSETALPGLRPYVNLSQFFIIFTFIIFRYVDQLTYSMNRITSSGIQSSTKNGMTVISPSTQSFLSRSGTKSDPLFNRQQQPLIRQVRTAQPLKSRADIVPMINVTTPTDPQQPTAPRPPTRPKMSRERLNRLAQPKGYRFKSAAAHTRSTASEEITPEDIFGKIDQVSQVTATPVQTILPNKPKSPADDKRFHHLVESFTEVHEPQKSNFQTVQNIIQANPSLQDREGHWKIQASIANRKAELKHHRQMLADKLHRKIDIFLIDVAA